MASKNVKMLLNKLPELKKNLAQLTKEATYVGVPSDGAERKEDGPNNAMLAYVHDNGSPAQNIPARPFMKPGIERAKKSITKALEIGVKKCIGGDESAVDIALHESGLIAQRSIRDRINEGIAPALSEATLKARIRNRRGAKGARIELERREEGKMPSSTVAAKPLINTGQLRNSINYVIRKK